MHSTVPMLSHRSSQGMNEVSLLPSPSTREKTPEKLNNLSKVSLQKVTEVGFEPRSAWLPHHSVLSTATGAAPKISRYTQNTSGSTVQVSEPAEPLPFVLFLSFQLLCKLVVGVPNHPLCRVLWIIKLSTGNGSLLLVWNSTMKVRRYLESWFFLCGETRLCLGWEPPSQSCDHRDWGARHPVDSENRQHPGMARQQCSTLSRQGSPSRWPSPPLAVVNERCLSREGKELRFFPKSKLEGFHDLSHLTLKTSPNGSWYYPGFTDEWTEAQEVVFPRTPKSW